MPSSRHAAVHKVALPAAVALVVFALVTAIWPARPAVAVEPADPLVPADAVSWADRSGVRAVTERLATDPQYSGSYLAWTAITIGSLRTELAVTPEFVASTGPVSQDQLAVAEYIAPVFSQGEPIVAVGFRRSADGGWELGPQIYPAAVGAAVESLPYGVVVLFEQTNGAWFALEENMLSPMGPKSAALLGDGPVDLTTLRDRLAQGPTTAPPSAPAEADVASSPANEPTARLGLWFWLTAAAGVILVVAILLQMASARRRRRSRRHIRRLA